MLFKLFKHFIIKTKKGEMYLNEIIRIIIILIVLAIIIAGIFFLFWQKGGDLISSMRDFFRFGR